MTPISMYGEPYVHKFCAVDNFWNITLHKAIYHPLPCSIPVRAWFHDATGDIDFYQMSLSQSE